MNESIDNFEDFFRQSFKDEEVINQTGDWNVPSDRVWEGIQENLTEERKLSFAFLKWPWSAIAASYLLLMGGYQFMEEYTMPSEVDRVIVAEELTNNTNLQITETLYSDLLIRSEKMEQVVNLTKENSISPKGNSMESASRIPSYGRAKTAGKQKEHGVDYLDNSRHYIGALDRSDFQKSDLLFSTLTNVDEVEMANNQLITKKETTPKSTDIATLERLANPNFKNLFSLDAKVPMINLTPITLPVKAPSNSYIAANYSTISEDLTRQNLSQEPTDLVIADVKNSKGNRVGVDMGWTNKKGWGIETGVHYTKMTREIEVHQEIPAQVLQTNLNAGRPSHLDLAWNDANGKNEVGLSINNSLNPSTDLSIQLTQNTKSHFIEVPLVVRKKWRIGKLDVGVKTGLVNHFNVSNSFEAPTITLDDNQFEVLASEFRRNTTIENKKYIPQLIAGVSLEYFIQPNLSVYVEPSFSKSIRPVIDFGFANIHSQNKAVTMGMRYHL